MGGAKTTSSTSATYEPETGQALESEIQMFLGNLQPIQREQLMKYATIMPNQPGRVGASALAPPSTFAPLSAAQQEGQERLNLPEGAIAGIGEGLLGGQAQIYPQAYQSAQGITSGIQSTIDPRFTEQMKPLMQQTSETEPDKGQMAMQAGAMAVSIAIAVAAAIA